MATKLEKLKALRKALKADGAGGILKSVVEAGCDETLLLFALLMVTEADAGTVYNWPDWLTVNKLDRVLALVKELQAEIRMLNKTAVGFSGSLFRFRFPRYYSNLVGGLPLRLTFAEIAYEHLRDDVAEFNPQKSRQLRAQRHAAVSMLVYASTKRYRDEDVSELIEAAYRVEGMRVTVGADSLKKFRTRHPLSALTALLPFLDGKSAKELETKIAALRARTDEA